MSDIELSKQLDSVRLKIFVHDKFSAFYGPLMCSLHFIWDDETNNTAYTDGERLAFNREFFTQLTTDQRLAVTQHEIEHVARLHMIRGEGLDPEDWNRACDYVINQDLRDRGYDISSIKGVLLDPKYKGKTEEEVYYMLQQSKSPNKPQPFGGSSGDMVPGSMSGVTKEEILSRVMQAQEAMKMSGREAGNIPGNVTGYIDALLKPVVDWKSLLRKFLVDKIRGGRSWKRPNRRYAPQGIYLPSKSMQDGKLDHLMWFFDVSGSVTDEQLQRFNSEVKHVHENLKPRKMTIVQFDTKIQKIDVLLDHHNFSGIEIVGRGGTSLHHVRKLIDKEKPTAAIVFSDLYCTPMDPLTSKTDVLWIVIDHESATIPFGKAIHIKE